MIELSAVTKSFGQNHVLRGVDLVIPKGSSMVVIGGSGTGKSVLLKCILGLVRHDGGTITLDGQDVTRAERDPFLARFGMLFQGGALFDSLRIWENVAFRLLRGALKKPKAEAREIAGMGPTYVTYDIDFVDPTFAPGTGTPEVGGPNSWQALEVARGLRGLDIVGAYLVEVSPPFDPSGGTAWLGVSLMFELLCAMAEAVERAR